MQKRRNYTCNWSEEIDKEVRGKSNSIRPVERTERNRKEVPIRLENKVIQFRKMYELSDGIRKMKTRKR